MRRLTISLDDDLYAVVKSLARADDMSLSAAISVLLRRAVFPTEPVSVPSVRNGLAVVDGRPVTSEDVRRMEAQLDEEYGSRK